MDNSSFIDMGECTNKAQGISGSLKHVFLKGTFFICSCKQIPPFYCNPLIKLFMAFAGLVIIVVIDISHVLKTQVSSTQNKLTL